MPPVPGREPAAGEVLPGVRAPLALKCAPCGTELPAEAKFCVECGHPVGQAAPPRPRARAPSPTRPSTSPSASSPPAPPSKASASRSPSCSPTSRAPWSCSPTATPRRRARILDPVLERMMEAVHRYEGTVNQVMGDGIMALFGAPLAHEDHAVRACYAALRMQESGQAVRRGGAAHARASTSRSASG